MDKKQIEEAAENIYGLENDPVNVRKKVAFIQGAKWMEEEQFKVITNFINQICKIAEEKKERNKHRPLSEASIEAETAVSVCKGILSSINNNKQ